MKKIIWADYIILTKAFIYSHQKENSQLLGGFLKTSQKLLETVGLIDVEIIKKYENTYIIHKFHLFFYKI